MSAPPADHEAENRRAETNERFVAFAFAGADLMAETEADGTITYAAGAFQTKFGRPAETFVGARVQSLVAPADHEALGSALCVLAQRGRLPPFMLRLADTARTPLALAGILLPAGKRSQRLCLTFARPPEPAASVLHPRTPQAFARLAEAHVRSGTPGELKLLEIGGKGGRLANLDSHSVGVALNAVAPDAQSGVLGPGRYGVIGGTVAGNGGQSMEGALQNALRDQGIDVTVTAKKLDLEPDGLTQAQAARALKQALNAFAQDGVRGLDAAGLSQTLAGYMKSAGRKADIMRRVIREGRFSLSYQPIVCLHRRTVHHYEALIRPRGIPELPMSGPQDFVMLVEALGLADELDLRVAAVACDEAMRSRQSVGFNISGQSVQNPKFRHHFIDRLRIHPACRAGLVMVEMTETAEIENVEEALLTATALRDIGVPFCLDDFGAGAADMNLLRRLLPSIVKLDGSYVAGIGACGRERAFVAGMVEIARAVGAEVVAERVETEEEAKILTGLQVQYGQGWLFGRAQDLPTR
jgi:EAL domain-containing protein (putative c-di-GMP-specific phosphodiesterase class I)